MTSRRPWWSEFRRQVAALVAGGLLALPAAPLAAAPAETAGKPATHTPIHRAVHPAKRPAKAPAPSRALVVAETEDDGAFGLRGQASFYGHGFQGRRTSTGERFDVREFTAASNRFPLGSLVAVRRLDDDRCAVVKINDRMMGHRKRIIDVSRSAAEYLGMLRAGVVLVRIAPLKPGAVGRTAGACQAAFVPEAACADCTPPLPANDEAAD